MMKEQNIRIVKELLAGVVVSVVLSAIFIAWGYFHVNADGLNDYSVKVLFLKIYDITLADKGYVGTANNQNMGIFGIMCSIFLVFVNEIRVYFKTKIKSKEAES